MSGYDFNDAEPMRETTLIPINTIAPIIMTIKPGGAGDGGWLKQSSTSDVMMLDCEFTIVEGPYAKRKVWQRLAISGGKIDEKGKSIAGRIGERMLRGILESSRNINPDDKSEEACKKRRINEWGDFNGMTFIGKIGIEKDKTGQYSDKNKIIDIITPGKKEYDPHYVSDSTSMKGIDVQTGNDDSRNWGNASPSESGASSPVPSWAK